MRLSFGMSSMTTSALALVLTTACGNGLDSPLDVSVSGEATRLSAASDTLPNGQKFANDSGDSETFNPGGSTDLTNEFFQDLGVNGRTCVTCHTPAEGWTIRPDVVQQRFDATDGTDPLFRTNDGSNSPVADVSTVEARREAYSMLLTKALIRVGIGIPAGAEFELIDADDPYGWASAKELSLFRRPLPSANLPFLSRVMWDGRVDEGDLLANLAAQSNGATQGHAGAPDPISQATRESIVNLEFNLFNAQSHDDGAAELHGAGGRGGPTHLADETGEGSGFDIYDAWSGLPEDGTDAARAAIARGQNVFNSNDCVKCHNVGNVGTDSRGRFFDIGISAPERRTDDLPLYTLRNLSTGEIRETTDPGRALITGLWRDVDRFKAPGLRGLAARPPYFHDGSAASLEAAVDFYDQRFQMGLTKFERADMVAFLRTL